MCVHAKSLQSHLTFCDPMDRSLPGFSVHGILQGRSLEWVSMPFSRGSSPPRGPNRVSYPLLHWQAGSLPLARPGKLSGKESTCQCRRHKRCALDPWVRKIFWSRKWQPAPVILAWKIPRTEEPGELQSMGSQRVRHNCAHTRAFSYSRHLMWGTEPGYLKDEPVWDAVALVTCSARVFQYL